MVSRQFSDKSRYGPLYTRTIVKGEMELLLRRQVLIVENLRIL